MWISLSQNDVLTRLGDPELTAYQTTALADGQADPLPEILAGVAHEVRSRVAAWPQHQLAPEPLIPDELLHHSLAIARYRLMTRLPVAIDDAREQEYRDALSALRDVSAGRIAITAPDSLADPAEQAGASAVRVVSSAATTTTGGVLSRFGF